MNADQSESAGKQLAMVGVNHGEGQRRKLWADRVVN
jgi:hypothetical protein